LAETESLGDMVETVRALTSQDTPALNDLVTRAFSYPTGQTYLDDFPIWDLRLGKFTEQLGLFDSNRLLSHVGYRRWNLRRGESTFKIAAVGAVATDASARGKGFATKLLRQILQKIDAEDFDFALLWGSEHEFYKQFGFHLGGHQHRVPVTEWAKVNPLPNEAARTISLQSGWNQKILDAMCARKSSIQFTPNDHSWLEKQKTIHWFWLDNPFGFIGIGRGMDLPGIIHEYGGDQGQVARLIHYFAKELPDLQWIGPATEAVFSQYVENLALIRPVHKKDWPEKIWISGLGGV